MLRPVAARSSSSSRVCSAQDDSMNARQLSCWRGVNGSVTPPTITLSNLKYQPLIASSHVMTPRLELRGCRPSDFDAVHAYATDPEVCRYMDWGPNTPAMTRQWL